MSPCIRTRQAACEFAGVFCQNETRMATRATLPVAPGAKPAWPVHRFHGCRLLRLLSYRRIHRGTPHVAILRQAAPHDVEVELLQGAADWSDFAIADGTMIDHYNRRELRTRAAQEYFVRHIEFGTINLALARDASQLAAGQFHHRFACDAEQDILGWSGRDQFVINDQEDVFRAALRHVSIMGQHNSLVEAVLHGLTFREGRIDVGANDFRAGGNGVIIYTPP